VKPDIIYQLASASMGGQDPELVLPAFENDLRTTVNALVVARECRVRRVIITRSLDEPLPGDSAKAPPSPYAAAKAASGLYGRMFYELYRLPIVMLRPFMTYGPGQKAHKVIPYTILAMLKGKSPGLSAGTRGVDWVYVSDVISAFITAAIQPEAIGKEIDLGTGTLIPVRDIVEEIRQLIPGAPQPIFASRSDRVNEMIRSADVKTAAVSLGWRFTTPLREGLSETIDWYRCRLNLAASSPAYQCRSLS
jgi:nucleoside-diphosphate-sugar epimerase